MIADTVNKVNSKPSIIDDTHLILVKSDTILLFICQKYEYLFTRFHT